MGGEEWGADCKICVGHQSLAASPRSALVDACRQLQQAILSTTVDLDWIFKSLFTHYRRSVEMCGVHKLDSMLHKISVILCAPGHDPACVSDDGCMTQS